MTEYRIAESERFRRDLDWLPPGRQRRVLANLRAIVYPQLRAHPHFGPNIRRLPDWDPPLWCFRVGAWTFFYEIDEPAAVVFMAAAQHRAASY